MQDLLQECLQSLKKNNFAAHHLQTPSQLFSLLTQLLAGKKTIGCGDSVTLEQLGVFDFLRAGAYHFLDKHKAGLSSQEKKRTLPAKF